MLPEPSTNAHLGPVAPPLLSREGLARASRTAQPFTKATAVIAGVAGMVGILLPWVSVDREGTFARKNGFGSAFDTSDNLARVMGRADITLTGWPVCALLAWVLLATFLPLRRLLSPRASIWSRVAASAGAVILILIAYASIADWVDWYNTGVEDVAPGSGLSASVSLGLWVSLLASLVTLAACAANAIAKHDASGGQEPGGSRERLPAPGVGLTNEAP